MQRLRVPPVALPPLLVVAVAASAGLGAIAGGAPIAAVGFAVVGAALATAIGFRRTRSAFRAAYVTPMQQILAAVRDLRATGAIGRVPELGSPLSCALVRAVNDASSFLHERQRQSQAGLLSLEIAFDRVHSVLQSLGEGVLVVGREGELVLANQAAERYLADDPAQALGRGLDEAVRTGVAATLRDAVADLERRGETTTTLRGVPFERSRLDVAVARVRSPRTGEDRGHVIVLIDVTQNFAVARMKDEFLSSVSHELRTPLTNVVSFAELLTQMPTAHAPEIAEFAGIILAEGRRLARLVDDVLEYNQLETGEITVAAHPVDVGKVAQLAVDAFAQSARAKEIELRLAVDGAPVVAMADQRQLTKVLSRLLDNALKFTAPGGHVVVEVERERDAVTVAVADDGPGIPLALQEKVFERFFQIGDPLTEKPAGAGLGLAIGKSIVEHLGGTIRCEDASSGGARFVLTLAAAPEPATAIARPVG